DGAVTVAPLHPSVHLDEVRLASRAVDVDDEGQRSTVLRLLAHVEVDPPAEPVPGEIHTVGLAPQPSGVRTRLVESGKRRLDGSARGRSGGGGRRRRASRWGRNG